MPLVVRALATAVLVTVLGTDFAAHSAMADKRPPAGVAVDERGDVITCPGYGFCNPGSHKGPLDISRAKAVRTDTGFRVSTRVPRPQAGKYQPFVEVSPGQFHSDGQAWFVYLSAEKSRVGFVPEADEQISGSLSGKVCEGGGYTVTDRALMMTIPLSCAGKAATADQPRFMVSTRHVRKDGETTDSDYAPEYTEPAALVAIR